MTEIRKAVWLIVLGVCVFTLAAPVAAEGIRVGVYDSRMVAMAYASSGEFLTGMNELKARHRLAQKKGDVETVAMLEKEGPAIQDRLHKQVFGNAPIPGLMKRIEKNLPTIAKEAGVDLIVCKWDIAFEAKGTEYTDITLLLVKLFNPSEETLQGLAELKNHPPVPLEELEAHEH